MTDEEMNQKMEFIVEHQAKFAADLEMMSQTHAEDVRLLKYQDQRLSDAYVSLIDVLGNLTRAQTRTDESVHHLTEDVARLTEAQKRTDERLAQTDERLNIFINVVERYISGNGGAESPA